MGGWGGGWGTDRDTECQGLGETPGGGTLSGALQGGKWRVNEVGWQDVDSGRLDPISHHSGVTLLKWSGLRGGSRPCRRGYCRILGSEVLSTKLGSVAYQLLTLHRTSPKLFPKL